MITKYDDFRNPRRNSLVSEFDYVGDGVAINQRQKKTLYDLINYNIQDPDERENRLSELENLTSLEAEDIIFQYLSATWS